MIEKLLQFLVAKIDAQLFEAIEVKDFEACNVQHSDETNPKMKIIFEVQLWTIEVILEYICIQQERWKVSRFTIYIIADSS